MSLLLQSTAGEAYFELFRVGNDSSSMNFATVGIRERQWHLLISPNVTSHLMGRPRGRLLALFSSLRTIH